MTDSCNIIRDLIPLVIDEAASEDSKAYVASHLDFCEDCRACYQAMQTALSEDKAREEEQKSFEKAAIKLKKQRRTRILRIVVIGMLLGCVLCYGGLLGWDYLYMNYNQLVYHGFYGVTLSKLQSGEVSVNIDYQGSSMLCAVSFDQVQEDDKNILYVYLERPIIRQYAQSPLSNYSCSRLSPESMAEIDEIRQGKAGEYVLLWQKGADIPAASEEMEAYFALNNEYWALWDSSPSTSDGKLLVSQETRLQMEELRMQLDAITVPEWQ